ncbi:TauD/TfdA family dioxygenase [Siccirubricoccus soli]|uniref:TauD/TfdA family dioxygenase n=1 Tax=Siccirubricoccus soli TaxID=2899147 RepID=UPI00273A6156|nr:TauD/TfdA family dioxygenase [Siccirubricoccus soli]
MPQSRHPVTEPAAWTRAEMEADPGWRFQLTAEQIAELEAALASVQARGLPMAAVTREDFPLPSWAGLLAAIRAQLRTGRGVALLRGLPVARYTEEEARLAHWGIGTYLGEAVTQNAAAELMAGVYDRGQTYGGDVRAYQVRAELSMHCDNSDLVALFCLRQAKSGGETLLTSALSIYNRLLAEMPETLPLLEAGFPYDRKGEQGPGEPPISAPIPVFARASDGTVSARYARSYITRAEQRSGIPLSPEGKAALDAFDRIALDPALMLEFHLQPGDIQFANNYTVLHARRGFEDYPEPERRRLMLRLWLQDESLRRVEDMQLRFGFTRFGNHGRTARELLAA